MKVSKCIFRLFLLVCIPAFSLCESYAGGLIGSGEKESSRLKEELAEALSRKDQYAQQKEIRLEDLKRCLKSDGSWEELSWEEPAGWDEDAGWEEASPPAGKSREESSNVFSKMFICLEINMLYIWCFRHNFTNLR